MIGGCDSKWNTIDSIEMLNLSVPNDDLNDEDASWKVIRPEGFTKRYNASVGALDSTQLIIFGGFDDGSYLSDVILLDVRTMEARKALNAPFGLRNSWHN